ncbi:hypothetical protein DLJ48_08380 [Oenococcus sicerae]|uniref:Uncharacterized protein n=1 Tax=Oenococcus sicerae TaxID=2203724 RepID=A0ABX5QP63_9LACO|nr:hypothetical protein [Oenococcus sicerae]QAS70537.1 hypothetical protein DLJ48_08380 [Oenococcus sicerae]
MNLLVRIVESILLLSVGYFLRDLPNLVREVIINKNKVSGQRTLQVESYFRQISGDDLNQLLKDWSAKIIYLNDKKQNDQEHDELEKYKDLMHRSLMYGSDKTVSLLAYFSQFQYRTYAEDSNVGKTDEQLKNAAIGIMYMSRIVASLKYDFTGYQIDPLDIMKLIINDLDSGDHWERMLAANKEIDNILAKQK